MDSVKLPLKHQSWLVAAVCMAADGGLALFENDYPWPGLVVLPLTLAVDAMLGGPARLSGWVALAQAALPVLVFVWLGPGIECNDAGQLIAAYRAGAWLRGKPAYLSLAVLFGSLVGWSLSIGLGVAEAALVAVKAALLPWLVGRYTTARRAYLAELEKRREMEQRDAKAAVAQAIADERSAIARDLHDVIVHHVSAIGLHAGAARLSLPEEDSKLAVPLRAVETSSRAAMVDLRHLLDLLHGDKSEGARQPGLDNVDELLENVRAAGIPARLEVRGKKRDVPESLDITVYRIIQEMLTNALRHGDASGVRVTLDYASAALVVAAENVAGGQDGTGTVRRGLVGIRNRASMFGGTTDCGLEPDGRTWRTVVTFPLEAS